MPLIETLSQLDVYRISYLTMKGWEYCHIDKCWRKDGQTLYKTMFFGEEKLTPDFELEEAYWYQRGLDEKG